MPKLAFPTITIAFFALMVALLKLDHILEKQSALMLIDRMFPTQSLETNYSKMPKWHQEVFTACQANTIGTLEEVMANLHEGNFSRIRLLINKLRLKGEKEKKLLSLLSAIEQNSSAEISSAARRLSSQELISYLKLLATDSLYEEC